MQTIQDFKKITEKNDGIDYFTASAKRRSDSPKAYDAAQDKAISTGKQNAAAIINSARDYNDKFHAKNLKIYQGFDCNPTACENAQIKDALKKADVAPIQYRNIAFESKVLTQYPIKIATGGTQIGYYTALTPFDVDVLDKFKQTMSARWNSVGYDGTEDFINNFWKENTLSCLKNNQPFASAASAVTQGA
jgi:hypothetical protein